MLLPPLKSRLILYTRVDATSYQDASSRIVSWLSEETYGYIVAANVHVVMTGYWQPNYQKILQKALLVTPDGMPLVWGLKLLGLRDQTRVYGPDLMLTLCEKLAKLQIPIFLYGGTCQMLSKLEKNLLALFPSLIIAGTSSPPFRLLSAEEEALEREKIIKSGAKVVMVGLGCPKQEEWMSRQQGKLNAILLGVGAAFSFHSHEVKQAPRWMMKLGLEWFYRLLVEPGRLWRRYLINNPAFLCLFAMQLLRKQFGEPGENLDSQ